MKTTVRTFFLVTALAAGAAGCASESNEEAYAPMHDAASADTVSAGSEVTAGALPLNSPERKLIHTAELHAEVPRLYDATSRIEARTVQLGGQVSSSTMQKAFREERAERSGSDSLRELRRYSGTAQLTLRVPVSRLDSLLGFIAAQTSFIENRRLAIDDATFRHIENALRNRRMPVTGETVAGASPADGLEAKQYLDQLRSQAVGREVENMRVDDQAAYASISLALSAGDEVVVRTVPDIDRLMQPGPGTRFVAALRGGWEILYDLLLFLLGIWPVLLMLGLTAFLLRRWYARQQATPKGVRA